MDPHLLLPLTTNYSQTQHPPPPTTPKFKFSIGGLTRLSFYHLLVVSFFVSVERFPETDFFTFLSYGSVHIALYSQLAVIEAFYGLAFLASIPKSSDNAAVEFAGLMIANGVIVNHMIFMINNTLFRYTTGWWIICIFLMFARLTGDILKQIYAKIYPTTPFSTIPISTIPILTIPIPTAAISIPTPAIFTEAIRTTPERTVTPITTTTTTSNRYSYHHYHHHF